MIRRLLSRIETHRGGVIVGLILFTLFVRWAAWVVIGPTPESDGLAYFTIAKAMASGAFPVDQFGQHVFYSIGYPLFLTPFFALFGAHPVSAFLANLCLAAATALLLLKLAAEVKIPAPYALLLLLLHSVWLPGIWNSSMLARENLSTPLLLSVLLLALRMANGRIRPVTALGAGMVYGAAVLTGGSALPIVVAPLIALVILSRGRWQAMMRPMLILVAGVLLVLTPWLCLTQIMVGQPVLNSNGGFNLYLGNNPAATGRFVSIADTPAGPQWTHMRQNLGEVGASAELGARAMEYAAAHPAHIILLSLEKLTLFWAPNVPDTADFNQSRAIANVRLIEVAQYMMFLALGLVGLCAGPVAVRDRWIIAATIGGFWGLHAVAYIIIRYRDPVMPVVMLLAVAGLCAISDAVRGRRKGMPHAA